MLVLAVAEGQTLDLQQRGRGRLGRGQRLGAEPGAQFLGIGVIQYDGVNVGGVLGGVISDWLMRRTGSLNIARKTPIVLGMLLSMTMVFCNYVNAEWMIIGFMAMAFFGKGIGALGWAVMADTAPKEISGLSGGLFNMFGNISGIVTPIAIGYIVGTTGSFNGALIYVGVHALVAVLSYLVLVGDIKRIELKPVAERG